MGKRSVVLLGTSLLFISMLSFAWVSVSTAASAEPIKIGCMLDLTSYLSVPCKPALQGIQIKIEEAGSINGRRVQLIIEDDASNPDQAMDKARKLVERDKVKAIIGPLGAVPAAAVAPYLAQRKIPSIAIISQTDEVASMRSLTYLPHGHNAQLGYGTGNLRLRCRGQDGGDQRHGLRRWTFRNGRVCGSLCQRTGG